MSVRARKSRRAYVCARYLACYKIRDRGHTACKSGTPTTGAAAGATGAAPARPSIGASSTAASSSSPGRTPVGDQPSAMSTGSALASGIRRWPRAPRRLSRWPHKTSAARKDIAVSEVTETNNSGSSPMAGESSSGRPWWCAALYTTTSWSLAGSCNTVRSWRAHSLWKDSCREDGGAGGGGDGSGGCGDGGGGGEGSGDGEGGSHSSGTPSWARRCAGVAMLRSAGSPPTRFLRRSRPRRARVAPRTSAGSPPRTAIARTGSTQSLPRSKQP